MAIISDVKNFSAAALASASLAFSPGARAWNNPPPPGQPTQQQGQGQDQGQGQQQGESQGQGQGQSSQNTNGNSNKNAASSQADASATGGKASTGPVSATTGPSQSASTTGPVTVGPTSSSSNTGPVTVGPQTATGGQGGTSSNSMALNEIWKLPANAIAVPGVAAGQLPTQFPVICIDSKAEVGSGFSVGGSSYSGSGAVAWHGKSTEISKTNLDCINVVTLAEKDLREVDVKITDIRAGVDRDRAVLGTGNPAFQTVIIEQRYPDGIKTFLSPDGQAFYKFVALPAPSTPSVTTPASAVTLSKGEHKTGVHHAANTINVTAPAGTSISIGCQEQCSLRPAPASKAEAAAAPNGP